MYLELQQRLLARVRQVIQNTYGIELGSIAIEQPPDLKMGEYALPVAFELARKLRNQRRLARAIRTDQRVDFATNDLQRDVVRRYQAAEALKRGRLKIVLAKFEQPALPIHIVYPTSRLLSAKVRAFIDLVTEISDWHFG